MGGCYIPKRYIVVALMHYGTFCMYSLRVNLSVAIVTMVNQTYANVKKTAIRECATSTNLTTTDISEVNIINPAGKIAKNTHWRSVFLFNRHSKYDAFL